MWRKYVQKERLVERSVNINGQIFTYELERKRIKNLNMRIRPDGSIHVSAPMRLSDSVIERFVSDKSGFILRSVQKINERMDNNMRPSVFETGTRVKVFGQVKELLVMKGPRNGAYQDGDKIVLWIRNVDDQETISKVYNKWRAECLKQKVLSLCDEICPVFVKLGAKKPSAIKFRTMRSRWGSCKPKEGVITFNYNLFEVPEDCVRYVVVHEFAHLLVPDHSDKFYRYVQMVMPDWKEKRRLLNEY